MTTFPKLNFILNLPLLKFVKRQLIALSFRVLLLESSTQHVFNKGTFSTIRLANHSNLKFDLFLHIIIMKKRSVHLRKLSECSLTKQKVKNRISEIKKNGRCSRKEFIHTLPQMWENRRSNTQHFFEDTRKFKEKAVYDQGRTEIQWKKWKIKELNSSVEKYFQKTRKILENKEKENLEEEFCQSILVRRKEYMEVLNLKNNLQMAKKKQHIVENLKLEASKKISNYFDLMEDEIVEKFSHVKNSILSKANVIQSDSK